MGDGGDETAGGVALDATLTAEDVSPGSSPEDPGADEIGTGTRVDRYVVLDRVGAGGMGVVFAAYDPELDRRVALKFLHAGPRAMDDRARDRFRREAQAMARVSHRNVASVYDVGTYRGQLFLTMEFVEGSTLRERLDELGGDWRAKWELLRAAGEGLAAAHARDIVHRDFKPENVLVNEAGGVRVTDFGLAHALGVLADAGDTGDETVSSGSLLDTPLTRTGGLLGTPKYMAPEQHSAARTTPATDQFAFCVVLYEALFGEHPFEGETAAELASAVVESDRRPAKTAPSIPASMRRALERGLSVVAGERFASMEALLEALDPDRTGRRRRRVVEVVAVVAVVGVAAFFALRPRGSGEPPGPDCHAYGDKLSEAWSDDRRSAVTAAFAANDLSYASATGKYFVDQVDEWAQSWSQMYVEACEATHVRGEQSSELLDLRMDCLERRLYDVGALVDVYSSEIDDKALERSTFVADKLPSLGRCDDAKSLRTLSPMPDDPDLSERIRGELRRVSETAALYEAGRYKASRELAADVYAVAGELGFPLLTAQAALELGNVLMRHGEVDEAEKALFVAAEQAAHAGDRELEAKAWTSLVALTGSYRADPKRALLLSRIARTAYARTAGTAKLEALLYINLGVAQYAAQEPADARDSAMRAVAVLEEAGDTHSYVFGTALGNLGAALTAMGENRAALDPLERSLEVRRKTLGERHPDLAYSLSASCGVHRRLGLLSRALVLCQEALDIREETYGREHIDVVYALGGVAVAHFELGRYSDAIRTLTDGTALYERIAGTDNPFFVTLLQYLAEMHREAGDLDTAEATLARAVAIWATLDGQREAHLDSPVVSGRIALDRHDADKARDECMRSVDMVGEDVAAHRGTYIAAQHCVGDAQLADAHWDGAITSFRAALEVADVGNNAPELLARLRFGLARALEGAGSGREAADHAAAALELFKRSEGPVDDETKQVESWLVAHPTE